MRTYDLDASSVKKDIYSGHLKLGGTNPAGDKIGFTNYYMEMNNEPYFGICGEFHFSRYDCEKWEEEIIKMKMCGINTIATYVIWIHHEEEEGIFDWTGNKNLREFVQLCKKHDMYFILRVGPFAHGEVRNGGIPDWLYGRPFHVRSNDEGYLYYAERLYKEISKQVEGLFFKDGGPIVGVQLENEFQSAGAPWEVTPPQVLEWVDSRGGEEHMKILKAMAIKCGIEAPIYTCTGWGGSPIIEDEILPLYGGYAFWPWLFYGDVKEHPATTEYLFRDYHNDNGKAFDLMPQYKITKYPFACCEIGGGMQVWYNYRFIASPESVEAMSFMKAASGCNFLGYYMFHGGSNPIGKHGYLNERTTPKISYDFQAPLGEFGQVRESYKRLKLLHYFFKEQEKELCKMITVLPEGNEKITPTDNETVRFAARVKDNSGYLFLNNYQDHYEMKEQDNFQIKLSLSDEKLTIPEEGGLILKKDVCCILPINLKLEDVLLKYSTTQFINSLEVNDVKYYFFFMPEGMKGEYAFSNENIKDLKAKNGAVRRMSHNIFIHVNDKDNNMIEITTNTDKKLVIYTMTREQSLNYWKIKLLGKERIVLSNMDIVASDSTLKLNTKHTEDRYIKIFPALENDIKVEGAKLRKEQQEDIFQNYSLSIQEKNIEFSIDKISDTREIIHFKEEAFKDVNELFLNIDYVGDVGYAYINGKLINDNFSNDTTWEIGLKNLEKQLLKEGMYIYISPIKKGAVVSRDSAMAAVKEVGGEEIAVIKEVNLIPEYSIKITIK